VDNPPLYHISSEKLLDQEYLTNDKAVLEEKLSSNVAGAGYDWNHYGFKITTAVGDTIPDFHLKAILPPAGDDGSVATRKQMEFIRGSGHAAIAATSEHKEAIVKFYDYVFSPEGRTLLSMGIEGRHWEYDANGEMQYTDFVLNNPDGITRDIIFEDAGINLTNPMVQSPLYEAISVDEETTAIRGELDKIITAPYPRVKFTDEEQMAINEKLTEINTYVSEMWDRYIMGLESLDGFDAYVQTLNDMGLQDMIAINQAAVDRYNT
jgi:putative aldouronate transport system substrate-binding protein